MVTIGLVADQYVSSYEYILQMIKHQTYQDYKIFIVLDKYDAINFAAIVDYINQMDFNPDNIQLKWNDQRLGIEDSIKWIYTHCHTEYCMILRNDDAFYDIYSLEQMVKKAEETKATSILGTSVYINSLGEFLTSTAEETMIAINPASKIICELDYPIIRKINRENQTEKQIKETSFKSDTTCTCYWMNRTDYKRYYYITKKENTSLVYDEIKCIQNNASYSKWGLTQSKSNLILCFQSFLQDDFLINRIQRRDRIVLLFLVMEYSTFPSVQKIVDIARKNNNFEVDLVYVPFYHPNKSRTDEEEIKTYKKHGYDIIHYEYYDLLNRCPDIAFFIKSYDWVPPKCYISEISRVIDRSVFIRYCPDNIDVNNSDFFEKTAYRSSLNVLAWKCYFSSVKMYNKAVAAAWKGFDNFELESAPRLDISLKDIRKDFPEEVESIQKMARGRKIIFWNSNHQIHQGDQLGTFFELGNELVEIFEEYRNLFFVWRPHPLFWKSLESVYSSDEVQSIREHVLLLENVWIDDSESYLPIFHISDALISDMSSLVGEYLQTLKPICLLISKQAYDIYPKEYLEILDNAYEGKDVAVFCENVLHSKDPLRKNRKACVSKYFCKSNVFMPASKKILRSIQKELI